MGKKSRARAAEVKAGKPGNNKLWLVVGGAAVMLLIVWFALRTPETTDSQVADNAVKAPVTLIATLSPDLYTGKARAAYQVAKDIPEVLAELPCFCGCMDGLGHKSNLYCFADSHGNICDLCQNIALEAKEMHSKGLPIKQIRDNIRTTYGSVKM